jgi:hypothetical protein
MMDKQAAAIKREAVSILDALTRTYLQAWCF